jgi:hypothetical protein
MVRKLDIDGDAQADLFGHGGEPPRCICLPSPEPRGPRGNQNHWIERNRILNLEEYL